MKIVFSHFVFLNGKDWMNNIKRSPSVSLFKKKIIGFIRPLHRSTYGVKDVEGIKLLTKLRTEFSDLRSHRFHHSFNCDNPVCSCLHEEESVSHYLLRCPRFNQLRNDLLGSISLCIWNDVSILPHQHLTNLLLYGSNVFDNLRNKVILEKTLAFIHKSKRFEKLEAFSIWFWRSDCKNHKHLHWTIVNTFNRRKVLIRTREKE